VDYLIGTRIIHFASSIIVGGGAIFGAAIANPALRLNGALSSHLIAQRQLNWLMLAGLVVAIASGFLWLCILAAQLSQSSLPETIAKGTVWSVLIGTQFGRVSEIRFVVAIVLAAILIRAVMLPSSKTEPSFLVSAMCGAVFVAALAWCGHAGAGLGFRGKLQVGNDIIHLVTSAMWVGGFIPLLLFIRPGLQVTVDERFRLVRQFSHVATLAVLLLAASGIVNTWFMTNGFQGIFTTSYGNLILAKIALFVTMLGFAAANRFWLTPRLSFSNTSQPNALRLLCLFTTVELALGLSVIFVVGILGQLEPAGHIHH
jgi:copper resistance protein D